MGSIGMPELIIILVIALIIFGAGKLPQIGENITLVQVGFFKTPYFGQHNEDRTMINPIMPLNTLFSGLMRAYKQSFDPVILDSKMNA
jgi:hypothetical protein